MSKYVVTILENRTVSLTVQTHPLIMLMVLDHSEPMAFDSKAIKSIISGHISERHITALFFIKSIYRTSTSECASYLYKLIEYVDKNNIDLFWAPNEEKLKSLCKNDINEIIDKESGIKLKDVWLSSVAHNPIKSWFNLVFIELPGLKKMLLTKANPHISNEWWLQ